MIDEARYTACRLWGDAGVVVPVIAQIEPGRNHGQVGTDVI